MIHDNARAAMYYIGENTFILVKIEKRLAKKWLIVKMHILFNQDDIKPTFFSKLHMKKGKDIVNKRTFL